MTQAADSYQNDIEECEALLSEGHVQDALQKYKNVMSGAPEEYHLWVNYASFLNRCGQYADAVSICQKANEIQPSAEGYHNLGTTYQKLGKIDEAIEALKKAIHFNRNFTHSHNDLAICFAIKRNNERAIDHMQIVTTMQPDNQRAWHDLARLRLNAKRYHEALSACRKALELDPSKGITIGLFSRIFFMCQDFDTNSQLVDDATACLKSDDSDPNMLKVITHGLFFNQPVVKTLVEQVEDYKFTNFEALLADPSLNWVILNHPLFVEMLRKIETANIDLEFMFTALRYHFLDLITREEISKLPWPEPLTFISALACQCYLNEYVFFESEDEIAMIETLEEKIKSSKNPDPYDIAILGCYRPLHKVSDIKKIIDKAETDNADFSVLVTVQVDEPLEEQEIKDSLPELTTIDDDISQLVKQQYEENPYPRWVQVSTLPPAPFIDFMVYSLPFLDRSGFKNLNAEAPSVLIAGCGTGKQIAYIVNTHLYSEITAVDISTSSLAYAKRQCDKKGFQNVTFGIADILKLDDLDKTFDLIACTGVLHHMNDPLEGLKSLERRLKPGGFMQLALYSEIARASIVASRKLITERGYDHDTQGIRACREYIKTLPPSHEIYPVMNSVDFFTTSMCRDLIFHFQEHRYTCLQLKEMLDEVGLEFLGFYFTNQDTYQRFSESYPDDPYGLDLDNWHEFEKQNPEIFKEMYQFWVQKPA